jgi:hypothetical protein
VRYHLLVPKPLPAARNGKVANKELAPVPLTATHSIATEIIRFMVHRLRSRWSIENTDKYLEDHYGVHRPCTFEMDVEENTAKAADPARRRREGQTARCRGRLGFSGAGTRATGHPPESCRHLSRGVEDALGRSIPAVDPLASDPVVFGCIPRDQRFPNVIVREIAMLVAVTGSP